MRHDSLGQPLVAMDVDTVHTHDKLVASDGTPDPAWYTDASGNILSDDDLFVRGDKMGLERRLMGELVEGYYTSHFRSGSLPTGYAYLTSGTVDGSTPATPAYSNASYQSDCLYNYNTSVSFLCKSTSVAALGKSIFATFIPSSANVVGLRVDKNNDNDFASMWMDNSGYGPGMVLSYNWKVGGSKTTVTGTINVPPHVPYTMRIYQGDVGGGNFVWYFYLETFVGTSIYMTQSGSIAQWGTTTVRSGLYNRSTTNGALCCDVFWDMFGA